MTGILLCIMGSFLFAVAACTESPVMEAEVTITTNWTVTIASNDADQELGVILFRSLGYATTNKVVLDVDSTVSTAVSFATNRFLFISNQDTGAVTRLVQNYTNLTYSAGKRYQDIYFVGGLPFMLTTASGSYTVGNDRYNPSKAGIFWLETDITAAEAKEAFSNVTYVEQGIPGIVGYAAGFGINWEKDFVTGGSPSANIRTNNAMDDGVYLTIENIYGINSFAGLTISDFLVDALTWTAHIESTVGGQGTTRPSFSGIPGNVGDPIVLKGDIFAYESIETNTSYDDDYTYQ